MYAYVASYQPLPLLEEFFMLDLLKTQSTSMMGFLTSTIDWNGPLHDDTWGMLASAIAAALSNFSNQSLEAFRSVSILLHISNCVIMFFLLRDVLAPPNDHRPALSTWLASGSSLIFAVYPLAPEAVSFIGGLSYQLGTAFFLTSFYLYVRGKRQRNWTILGLSWISFVFAVVSDSSLWSSGFIMVALELSISFIGPPPIASGAKVPTEDEVFEDAVDRLLEESIRHHKQAEMSSLPETSDTVSSITSKLPDRQNDKTPRLYDEDDNADSLFETLVPCLPLIVLGVLLSIRALPATGNEQLPSGMIAGFADWGRVFKHLFFPVNEAITADNTNAFLQLSSIYAIPLAVSIVAIIRNSQFRQNAAFLFAWLIVIIVPHLHMAISDPYLIGSRLAYSALVPTSAMIALVLFSPEYALSGLSWANKLKIKALTVSITSILLVAILALNFNRTVQQTITYTAGAKRLERLSDKVKKLASTAKVEYILIRDVPGDIAISGKISPSNVIIFDGQKKLLRAANVPGGFLKNALIAGECISSSETPTPSRTPLIVRWDDEKQTLANIDFQKSESSQENGIRLSGNQIFERAKPQVTNSESVHFDSSIGNTIIKSQSGSAPTVQFNAQDFPRLGDDFVYIECSIEMSKPQSDAQIRMYWLTSQQQNSDKNRSAYCSIKANSKQFQRYYFPIRSSAWTTSGQIDQIGFEFPRASRVVLKEIGTEKANNRIARLTYLKTERRPDKHVSHIPSHSRLTFDYPNLPQFGLVSVDKTGESAKLRYDTSMVENAQGALIEISRSESHFSQPNSDREAEDLLKTVFFENRIGEIEIPGRLLKSDGVYSIRVFATNKEGKLLGNASDEINCLIYSSPGS